MPNTLRPVITIASAAVMLLAAAGLVANRWRYVIAYHTGPTSHRSAIVARGSLTLGWAAVTTAPPYDSGVLLSGPRQARDANFGPYDWRPRLVWKRRSKVLVLPLWIPMLAGAAQAGWGFSRRPRQAEHACASCRYDLRGLDSTVCPECGTLRAL